MIHYQFDSLGNFVLTDQLFDFIIHCDTVWFHFFPSSYKTLNYCIIWFNCPVKKFIIEFITFKIILTH